MLNPQIWGPYLWGLLHSVTLLYPNKSSDKDRLMIRNFFNSYLFLLPCQKCREHYYKNLREFMLEKYMNSTKDMFTGDSICIII